MAAPPVIGGSRAAGSIETSVATNERAAADMLRSSLVHYTNIAMIIVGFALSIVTTALELIRPDILDPGQFVVGAVNGFLLIVGGSVLEGRENKAALECVDRMNRRLADEAKMGMESRRGRKKPEPSPLE